MACTSQKVTITDNGKELHFEVKQMPAVQGFLFGARTVRFLFNNSADLSGLTSLDAILAKCAGGFDFEEFKSLMDEALGSVWYTDGVTPRQCNGDNLNSIVTDPISVMTLFQKSIEINLNFIKRAMPDDLLERMLGALPQQAES
nr:MAG TPA: hypothetical protein [Caudoviricetes sp.]